MIHIVFYYICTMHMYCSNDCPVFIRVCDLICLEDPNCVETLPPASFMNDFFARRMRVEDLLRCMQCWPSILWDIC